MTVCPPSTRKWKAISKAVQESDIDGSILDEVYRYIDKKEPEVWNVITQRLWNQAVLELGELDKKFLGQYFDASDGLKAVPLYAFYDMVGFDPVTFKLINKLSLFTFLMQQVENKTKLEVNSFLFNFTRDSIKLGLWNGKSSMIQQLSDQLCNQMKLDCVNVDQESANYWLYEIDTYDNYPDEVIPEELCWQDQQSPWIRDWCFAYIGRTASFELMKTGHVIHSLPEEHRELTRYFLEYWITLESSDNMYLFYSGMRKNLGLRVNPFLNALKRLFNEKAWNNVSLPIVWDEINGVDPKVTMTWWKYATYVSVKARKCLIHNSQKDCKIHKEYMRTLFESNSEIMEQLLQWSKEPPVHFGSRSVENPHPFIPLCSFSNSQVSI